MIEFIIQVITSLGEAEGLGKAWLVGRGGGRGETPDSGDGVYEDRYNSK